jgi:hypothetical protein
MGKEMYVIELEAKLDKATKLIGLLKAENYQHMKDKVVYQDQILQLEMLLHEKNSDKLASW